MTFEVYSFKDITTGHFYLGIAKDAEVLKEEFETQLKNGRFRSTVMQANYTVKSKYKMTVYLRDTLEEAIKKRDELIETFLDNELHVNRKVGIKPSNDWSRAELEKTESFIACFLTSSYLYYLHPEARGICSDETFDWCCKRMVEDWDYIVHQHKHLIKLEDLKAGTGFALREHDYPGIVKSVASRMSLEVMEEK